MGLTLSRMSITTEKEKKSFITKEEKKKKWQEIRDFFANYRGPHQPYSIGGPYQPYSIEERLKWRPMCTKDCPITEIYNHEEGEACLRDPDEVWRLPAAMIVLKPDDAKAYMAAEAARAEEDRWWKEQCDWICTDEHCPVPITHARGEACKTSLEALFPPTPEPPASEAEEIIDDWDNWPRDKDGRFI
jgi:hypothetical protein